MQSAMPGLRPEHQQGEVTAACLSGLPPGSNLGAPQISVSSLLAYILFSLMFPGFLPSCADQ